MNIKNIGILTSGGDAPGMNAAIRSVTRLAIENGVTVWGIMRGFTGLRTGDMIEMNIRTVSDILHRGGTILYSSRDEKFKTEEGTQEAVKTCKLHNLDAVVVIGGNGSLKGAKALSDNGIRSIFIPATIDNDVACTDYSIGYDTAMNTGVEMVDKLRDTARSHEKCSVVEVMGRKCGDIALNIGIAVGATAILIPEVKYDFKKDVIDKIKYTQNLGRRHFIVVVAEGCEKTMEISNRITQDTGIESRCTILGHVQRGGSPTLRDRVFAGTMGSHAVKTIFNSSESKAISCKCDRIIDYSIDEALKIKKCFDINLYEEALKISI